MAEPLTKLTSKTVVLPAENIDTDQIMPARFLTITTRDGLGKHAFHDWRYDWLTNTSGQAFWFAPGKQQAKFSIRPRPVPESHVPMIVMVQRQKRTL